MSISYQIFSKQLYKRVYTNDVGSVFGTVVTDVRVEGGYSEKDGSATLKFLPTQRQDTFSHPDSEPLLAIQTQTSLQKGKWNE